MIQNDLKQIRGIVEDVLEQKLEEKFEQKLKPVKTQIKSIGTQIKSIGTQIKSMDKKINKLQEGQNIILKYVDDQDTRLEKRLNRIENHLRLPASTL